MCVFLPPLPFSSPRSLPVQSQIRFTLESDGDFNNASVFSETLRDFHLPPLFLTLSCPSLAFSFHSFRLCRIRRQCTFPCVSETREQPGFEGDPYCSLIFHIYPQLLLELHCGTFLPVSTANTGFKADHLAV